MKTEAIKQNIICNYTKLSGMVDVPQKENLVYIWGLQYKQGRTNGHVNQLGAVEINSSKIIINNGKINLVKKPFFLPWIYSLARINSMLENTIKNLNNEEIVQKRLVSFLSFPKSALEKLSKHRR